MERILSVPVGSVRCGRRIRRVMMIVALATAGNNDASAQRLSGVIVEQDARTPAQYVVVQAKDSTGRVVARTISSVAGAFRMELPLAGRYVISALRIGNLPTESQELRLDLNDERSMRLALESRPVVLPAVRVRARSRCSLDDARGPEFLIAWEQARAALFGVAASQPDPSLLLEAFTYTTEEGWPAGVARSIVDAPRTGRGDSFRSRSASELVRDGFVRTIGDSTEYSAPDAQVLLDEQFASGHCFWLEPGSSANPEWVGLGIGPSEAPMGRVDLSGILWLLRDGRLVRFDYQYVGLPAGLRESNAGGSVEFLELPTHQWIVWRWKLRFPRAALEWRTEGVGSHARTERKVRIESVVERGGVVTTAKWAGGRSFTIGARDLDLTVKNQDGSSQSLIGTSVESEADGRSWTLRSATEIRISPATPGMQRFQVTTPLMREAGVPAQRVTVPVLPDSGMLKGDLVVPSVDDVIRRLCGESPERLRTSAVVGWLARDRIAKSGGEAFLTRASRFDSSSAFTGSGQRVVIDSSGRWVACGLPRKETFVLWFEHDGARQILGRFRFPDGVDLVFVGAPERVVLLGQQPPDAARDAARAAILTIRVIDASDSSAVLDARVIVDDSLRLAASADSAYRSFGVENGMHRVSVRRMGHTPIDFEIMVVSGIARTALVKMERLPLLLADVLVAGRRVRADPRFQDVIRRAASGDGTLFTRDDLRDALDVHSVLTQVPGVHVTDQGVLFQRCQGGLPSPLKQAGGPPQGAEPISSADNSGKVQVYIDGTRVTMSGMSVNEALRLVHSRDIEYIEVYRGVARIPGEFLNDACAVIAIWTRRY